jgi:hypothetical protein
MDKIDSIIFTDNCTLTIRGSHVKNEYDYWGKEIIFTNKITDEITIKYSTYEMERIRRNYDWDISKLIGKEVPRNVREGQTESFLHPIDQKENKYFLFKFWDRYVIETYTGDH